MPKVLKSHGTQGAVVTNLRREDGDFKLEEPVFIAFDGLPVPFFIESIEEKGRHCIVKFEDVDSFDAAEELAGRDISFSPVDEDEDEDGIIGMTVCDKDGKKVGTIVEVMDYGGNCCISVRREKDEVILPLHEDLIVRSTKKSIWLTIPEGLL